MSRPAVLLFVCPAAVLLMAASPAAAQGPPFRVVAVRPAAPAELAATGRIVPVASARIGSRVAGRIAVFARDEAGNLLDAGSRVRAGQELFRVDPAPYAARVGLERAAVAAAVATLADLKAGTRPERVEAARAAADELAARADEARIDEARYRRLVEEDRSVPAKRLEDAKVLVRVIEAQLRAARARVAEAEAGPTATEIAAAEAKVAEAKSRVALAEVDLRETVVTAPFDGAITRRFRGPGDHVNAAPFVEVLEFVSDRDLEADLRLPEGALRELAPETTRVALRGDLVDGVLELPVTRVIPAVAPEDGVVAFRVAIPREKQGRLVPGAFVAGGVARQRTDGAVEVPAAALFAEGAEHVVFAVRNGVLRRVPVAVSDRLTDAVIVRGLDAADRVAVGPKDALRDGVPAGTPADSR